jgi:hypothetical protein
MKVKTLLLILVFALTPVMWAQEKPAPAPPPGGSQAQAEHHQKMMEMHKQEM